MPTSYRAFIGIPINLKKQPSLNKIIHSLQDLPQFHLQPPEKLHITLHFISKFFLRDELQFSESLQKYLMNIQPFQLQIESVDLFPNHKNPIVLAANIKENLAISMLQKGTGKILSKFGYEVETRPYRPHITIAKIRNNAELNFLKLPLNEKIQCNSLNLYSSTPTVKGSEYKVLKNFILK